MNTLKSLEHWTIVAVLGAAIAGSGCDLTTSFEEEDTDRNSNQPNDSDSSVCETPEPTPLAGDPIWITDFQTTGDAYVTAITHDTAGNIIVAGTFEEAFCIDKEPSLAQGSRDVFVSQIGPSGKVNWTKFFQGIGYKEVSDVAVDDDRNIFVTGYYVESINIGGGEYNSGKAGNSFIIKLDSQGGILWTKAEGSTASDRTTSLALDAAGSLYVTGYFGDGKDFGNGNVVTVSEGPDSISAALIVPIYLAKYNADGGLQYVTVFGNDEGMYFGQFDDLLVQVDSTNRPIMLVLNGDANLDFGGGVVDSMDAIVAVRFDEIGNFISNKILASKNGVDGTLRLTDFHITPEDGIVATGKFSGVAKFGETQFSSPGGKEDIFLLYTDSALDVLWTRDFSGGKRQLGDAVSINPQGTIYLTGTFYGELDLGGTPLNSEDGSFLAGFDFQGNNLWNFSIDNVFYFERTLDVDGMGNINRAGRTKYGFVVARYQR